MRAFRLRKIGSVSSARQQTKTAQDRCTLRLAAKVAWTHLFEVFTRSIGSENSDPYQVLDSSPKPRRIGSHFAWLHTLLASELQETREDNIWNGHDRHGPGILVIHYIIVGTQPKVHPHAGFPSTLRVAALLTNGPKGYTHPRSLHYASPRIALRHSIPHTPRPGVGACCYAGDSTSLLIEN